MGDGAIRRPRGARRGARAGARVRAVLPLGDAPFTDHAASDVGTSQFSDDRAAMAPSHDDAALAVGDDAIDGHLHSASLEVAADAPAPGAGR